MIIDIGKHQGAVDWNAMAGRWITWVSDTY